MERLEKIFGKELVESWGKELPNYAIKILELLGKKGVAGYEKIGYLKWYNSGYDTREEAEEKREMEVYFCKKEMKLYGSIVYNSVIREMILLESVNCKEGIVDTFGGIIKRVGTRKCCSCNANHFMSDFQCKKKEGIPYRIHKNVETYVIYTLKKEGGKGEFIAKEFSYDDAIRIMKNAGKEAYIVYINGEPSVFYKDEL
ncbi:MAG: hypothetical protein HFJ09_01330 [Lachnospiraceae bacterium]|nr:hypothetical protein [Lachnospiraceae bacterium]